MIYFKKGLHKKAVLILGNLITIEIFDLFQTWQLSIRSWSIHGVGSKCPFFAIFLPLYNFILY